MPGFLIRTGEGLLIHFNLYEQEATVTGRQFLSILPFTRKFVHARVSGQEIWTQDAPKLDIPQENSSVFAMPGEIAIGPLHPARNKVAGLMGIFYGEGKLVDGSNIFGRVADEDLLLLQQLGERIWTGGSETLTFEAWN
jgi:hypothetical protein